MATRKSKSASSTAKRSPSESAHPPSIFGNPATWKAVQLTILAAIYSPVSQLTLTPVYGSIPPTLYHRQALTATALITYISRKQLQQYIPERIASWIPAYCFWIPVIQFFLFKISSELGTTYGPAITELLTFYPLVFLTIHTAAIYLDKVDMSSYNPILADYGPSVAIYTLLTTSRRAANNLLAPNIGSTIVMSRVGLQHLVAALYAIAIPSAQLQLALPALGLTFLSNVHLPLIRTTNALNETLHSHNFSLIDRQESITGYISVLENTQAHYRVMRCDHSLLGGEWTIPPSKGFHPKVKEPIYAIFTMLEAVRLIEADPGKSITPDTTAKALNIGLGIGTAPSALIAHGINTTIIELDPVVYHFAQKYFGLPRNHTIAMGDAVRIVEISQRANLSSYYNYIIHDVFTGGAEPVDLFTLEFFQGLNTFLKPGGVIAIVLLATLLTGSDLAITNILQNYAGDLSLPTPSYIIRTIRAVFSSCRIFREDAAPVPGTSPDFTNMVIFCKKKDSTLPSSPLTFRRPTEADFLGSGARKAYLLPKHEVAPTVFQLEGEILRKGKTGLLQEWQRQSAAGHWQIMRTVLPPAVWENW